MGAPAGGTVRTSRAVVGELCAAARRAGGRVTVEQVIAATGVKRRRAYELLAAVQHEPG